MMRKVQPKTCVLIVISMMMMLLTIGCSVLSSKQKSTSKASAAQKAANKNGPVYYDFGDILLPRELKVDRDESFIFNSPGLTAGVLTLRGRIDASSLINFFKVRMPADGWGLIGSINAPHTKMLFKKETRWCVISIAEGQLKTGVEIWVSPTISGSEAGLTK
jgi:hypothetical protein